MTVTGFYRFSTDFLLVGAIVMWAVILLRLPCALRTREQRRLLVAVLGIAGSVTVYLDPVTALLNRTFVFANSCGLFMNVWGVLSSAFILDFVLAAMTRRRPWLVYGSALAGSAVLVALNATISPEAGCVTSVSAPAYSPFWWLLSAIHVVSVVPCAVLCARYAYRSATSRSVRAGLMLLAAGFASSGLFWTVVVLGYLLFRPAWLGAAFPFNIGLTAWLMAAGAALPLLLGLRQWGGAMRSLWRMGPLWRQLVRVVPNVALPAPKQRLLPAWSVDLRLYRRVIEIRDAILILGDYVDEDTRQRARQHVAGAGAHREELATACWLAVARAAKAAGTVPEANRGTPVSDPAPGEDDLTGEVAFLCRLSEVRDHPAVAAFAASERDPHLSRRGQTAPESTG